MKKRMCVSGVVLLTVGIVWIFAWQRDVQAKNSITEVSIERTACYGPCPVYKVTLRREGTATFVGSSHVDRIGTYKANFGGFDRLAQAIERRDYRHFKDHYTAPVTDLPHTITTVVQAGRHKTVDDYVNGPQGLWEIETLIDGAVAQAHWRKINSGGP